MILYVLIGGMKGHHLGADHQGHPAAAVHALITVFLLGSFGFNFSAILSQATQHNSLGKAISARHPVRQERAGLRVPRARPGARICSLPHVLMRFLHVPNARTCALAGLGDLVDGRLLPVHPVVATALPPWSARTHRARPGGENSAAPLLAYAIGGSVLLGLVSAVAFATDPRRGRRADPDRVVSFAQTCTPASSSAALPSRARRFGWPG